MGPLVSHTVRTTAPPCRPCSDRGCRLVRPCLRCCFCHRSRPLFPPPSATASCGYKRSAPPKSFPFSSPSAPASPLLSSPFASATAAPNADEKPSLLSPSHRPPRHLCASFLLEQDRPQAMALRVAKEKAVVQSPIHRAPPRGPAALTIPRGRLRRHDICPNSPPLHDLEPAPSAAPLLQLRRSPLLCLRRCGTPCSGEPSPLFGRHTGLPPCRLALRPLHHRPTVAGRPNFTGTSPVPMGEKTSPVFSRKADMGWASPIRMGRAL
jgi:hypothetical protein